MIEHVGSLLTGVAAVIAAIFAVLARKHASQTNDAVNHRHLTGTPRLYDMVLENTIVLKELSEWRNGYEGGPFDSGEKVERFMREWDEWRSKCKCMSDDCDFQKCDDCPEGPKT